MSQALSYIRQSVPEDVRPLLKRQYESWQQGTRVDVETMIQAAKPEHRAIAAQALIKQEIVLREESGEHPSFNEYRTRFPEYTDKLSRDWESEHEVTMVSMSPGEPSAKRDSQMDTNHEVFEKTFVSHPGQNDASDSGQATLGARHMPAAEVGDSVDEMIGPYRLTKKLGQGGMGAVYQATHTKLDKVVAIKLLSRQSGLEATAVERFEREMKAVGKLDHPNIVRAMDAGECDGFHYLVMEYVEGRDVSQWVKSRGPFTIGQGCEIVRQAALGLHEAHSLGLVHRDIKPSNLFLTSKGVIKILDLGLARLSEGTFNHELTQSGQCMGTPDYMAPEQWTNARDVDGRTDLYALGCTLYHVLAGRPPFGTSEHESLGSKVLAHTSGTVPDIRQLRTDLPDPVRQIMNCLLAKDRTQRFATGGDLASALQPYCEPLPGADALSASQIAMSHSVSGMRIPGQRGLSTRVKAIIAACSVMACLAAAFIIIKVRDPQGRVTEIKVPVGSSVTVVHPDAGTSKPGDPAPAVTPDGKPEKKTGQDLAAVSVRSVPASELPGMQPKKSAPDDTPADKPTTEAAGAGKGGKPMPTVVAAADVPKDEPAVEEILPPVTVTLPIDSEVLAKQQVAWARSKGRTATTERNSINMTMVIVPPVEFQMGSTPQELAGIPAGGGVSASSPQNLASEGPVHKVKISRPFAIGQSEVTVGQFREFVTATNYKTLAERPTATGLSMGEGIGPKQRGRQPTYSWQYVEGITAMDENPVSNLSWYDAVAFCEWLSQKEQATYRLPTEAEWEYVARAGLGMNVVGSPEWLDSVKTQANIADASAKRAYEPLNLTGTTTDWDDASAAVSPIGKFPANSLGLQDLIGNVSEFCSDRFDAEYYHNSPLENPLGPESGNLRVVRGASWQSGLAECRPGLRSFIAPNQTMMQVGFRVVQELPEPQPAGTTAPTETAPRREARIAEWALSLGGKVRVTFGPQPTNEILKVTDLPKRDYKVFSISLAETGVSDIGLLRLKGLAALQELDLSGNPITDPGLEVLAPFKTLTKLNLAGTHVTGDGLAQLLGCKKLADLDLSRCPVTDEKLDVVKGFVSLVALRLNGTSVSDAGLQALKPLVSLNELYLADTRVTGSGLNNLKRKDNLDPKKQLLVLDLSLTPIKDSNMELISNFPALRHLRLNWSAISDIGVEKFKQNYRLYELSLRGTEVSDHNEEMIGKARNIKLLDIRETDWTSSVVEGLKRTIKPPEAKIHWSNGDMNARCASYCLSVGGQVTIISDEGQAPKTITDAKDLPESAYYITSVQLSHLPVGDGWLWMVPKLSKLKELNLNGTRIDDAGLELLAKSQKIESLSLDGTLITETGLEHIAKMKQLKTLSVRDTRIPEAKVGNLRQQMVSTTVQ